MCVSQCVCMCVCLCVCVCVCEVVCVGAIKSYIGNSVSLFENFTIVSTMNTSGTKGIFPHHTKRGIHDLNIIGNSNYFALTWYQIQLLVIPFLFHF